MVFLVIYCIQTASLHIFGFVARKPGKLAKMSLRVIVKQHFRSSGIVKGVHVVECLRKAVVDEVIFATIHLQRHCADFEGVGDCIRQIFVPYTSHPIQNMVTGGRIQVSSGCPEDVPSVFLPLLPHGRIQDASAGWQIDVHPAGTKTRSVSRSRAAMWVSDLRWFGA